MSECLEIFRPLDIGGYYQMLYKVLHKLITECLNKISSNNIMIGIFIPHQLQREYLAGQRPETKSQIKKKKRKTKLKLNSNRSTTGI